MNHRLIGKRVQVPAHTDAWMRGSRYGEVTSVTKSGSARIKTDHGFVIYVLVEDVQEVSS